MASKRELNKDKFNKIILIKEGFNSSTSYIIKLLKSLIINSLI